MQWYPPLYQYAVPTAALYPPPYHCIDVPLYCCTVVPLSCVACRYHHTTVMLFCWHSYASRIGSAGLWFATMNYFVHSIMYLYFALTLHGSFLASKPFQKFLKRWVSPVVTSLQITQMVMGLVVLVAGTW